MIDIRRTVSWIFAISLFISTFAARAQDVSPAARAVSGSETPAPLRIAGSAFGAALEIEVRDLSRSTGEQALNAAWDAVAKADRALGALLTHGPTDQPLDEDLFELIVRANAFCVWSDGASGPSGGAVYRLWAESAQAGALPPPALLAAAVTTTACTRLELSADRRTIRLAAGSELDLRGFTHGWAVDLAMKALELAGATNARVTLGAVTRAAGTGPSGRGWPIPLPTLSVSGDAKSSVLLVDQAIAIAEPGANALQIAGDAVSPMLDLRSGKPATGVSSVVAVTALAADAEPLAQAMGVLGANGGQLRLGSLQPKPSVLWLLGTGDSAVVASSNWSAVRRP
ncbi:MAG: FAD:protein FMN transferase [Thermoanaerobaculia bacterium]